jgi:VanZ family protein
LTPAVSEQTVFQVLAALVLTGVLVLSFLPPDSVDPLRLQIGDSIDIGHVVAYAVLAATMLLSRPRQSLTLWQGAAVVAAISLLGIAIELLQPIVGRTTSVVDFAENEIGIAGGIALFWAYRRVKGPDPESRAGRAGNGGGSRGGE